MILTCPNCAVRYLLDSQALEPEGRRVRCSACKYVWFQHLEIPADDEPSLPKEHKQQEFSAEAIPKAVIPETGNFNPLFPEDYNIKPVINAIAASLLLFAVITGLLVFSRNGIVKLWQGSAVIYEAAGLKISLPGEGLVFDRVKASTRFDEKGEEVLKIEGRIVNLKDRDASLPVVKARFIDENGKVGEPWEIKLNDKKIPSTGSLTFNASHAGIEGNPSQVEIGFLGEENTSSPVSPPVQDITEETHLKPDNTKKTDSDAHNLNENL